MTCDVVVSGLLSEDQCKARDARRKSKHRPTVKREDAIPDSNDGCNSDHVSASFMSLGGAMAEAGEGCSGGDVPVLLGSPSVSSVLVREMVGPENPLAEMPSDLQQVLRFLLVLQDKFEFPTESEVRAATVSIWFGGDGCGVRWLWNS